MNTHSRSSNHDTLVLHFPVSRVSNVQDCKENLIRKQCCTREGSFSRMASAGELGLSATAPLICASASCMAFFASAAFSWQ